MSDGAPCAEYQQLKSQYESARSRWAQYANRHLKGTSERQSKQIRKEELANMTIFSVRMNVHRQKCPVCKGETVAT
jgi:hypothetical protein